MSVAIPAAIAGNLGPYQEKLNKDQENLNKVQTALKGAQKGAIAGAAPPAPSMPMTARLSMAFGPGARLNRKRASPMGGMGPKGFAPQAPNSPKFGEMVPTLGPPAQLPYRPQPYQGAQGMGGFGIPAPSNTGFSGYGFPGGTGTPMPQPLPPLQPLPFQEGPRPFSDPAPTAGQQEPGRFRF